MNYSKEFKKMLNQYKNSSIYIGTGNPTGKILIIGKECAIDISTINGKDQYKREILNNLQIWKTNVDADIKQADVEFKSNNPLYPYRGQKLTTKGGNRTSATWCYYQRLINQIVGTNENEDINFHEHCFISEMSDVPRSRSYKKEAKCSIEKRLDLFKNSEFFQKFPITILACGNYINGEKLCNTFGVTYFKKKNNPKWTEKNGFKFWVHYDRESNPQKIVIHTRQFSDFRVEKGESRILQENYFIQNIANVCNQFISKNEQLFKIHPKDA